MSKVFKEDEKKEYIDEIKRFLNINDNKYEEVIEYDFNKCSKWYNLKTLLRVLEKCEDNQMLIIGTLYNYSHAPCDYGFEIELENVIHEPDKHGEIIENAANERLKFIEDLLEDLEENIVDHYHNIIKFFEHDQLSKKFDPCEIEYINDDYELLGKLDYEEIYDAIIDYCKDGQTFNLNKIMGYGYVNDFFNDLVTAYI